MNKALIIIDIQNDFVPGGAMAVPDGDRVVPVTNGLMQKVDLVVATQDWHPWNHGSFVSQHPGRAVGEVVDLNGIDQILWPDHCVQGTDAAALVNGLDHSRIDRIFRKGTDAKIDSYSGFFDNGHRKATGLGEFLRQNNVTELLLTGLATDYCVKFTALDGIDLGFKVTLVTDGVKGVELHTGDCRRAIEEMREAGVVTATASELG